MLWLGTALAGAPVVTLDFVVDGEMVGRRHGEEYCSWPALPGITTKTRPLSEHAFLDPVFVADKDFTGLVAALPLGHQGALGLEIPKSLAQPMSQPKAFYEFFVGCRVEDLEPASMVELARKGSPESRAAVVRALVGVGLQTTKCGETHREHLMELGSACIEGKCEALGEKLAWLKGETTRCVTE